MPSRIIEATAAPSSRSGHVDSIGIFKRSSASRKIRCITEFRCYSYSCNCQQTPVLFMHGTWTPRERNSESLRGFRDREGRDRWKFIFEQQGCVIEDRMFNLGEIRTVSLLDDSVFLSVDEYLCLIARSFI